MFSPSACTLITRCWSRHFGWDDGNGPLWATPPRVLAHGGELMNYHGMMAMDAQGGSVVSLPPTIADDLTPVLLEPGAPPTENAKRLPPARISRVIGPAFIGYAEAVTGSHRHPVRLLGGKDASHVAGLQESCDAVEWEHGGSDLDETAAACGVFSGETLASLAGYEIWDGTIAHIAVVTHPAHRGMGFGQSAVAYLAGHALWKGLLPQYRTLEENGPSIAIAKSLGFEHFGTSVAVRLKEE